MARNENPPFNRGETFYNGGTITQDTAGGTNLYGGYEFEGKCWEFEDLVYTQSGVVGAKTYRTNRMVKCMAVRNASGIYLYPTYLVQLATSGTKLLGQATGYANSLAQGLVGVVDEWLPSTGVPPNDLFWVVVAGPTSVWTPQDGAADNVILVGDPIVANTASASTFSSTTSAPTNSNAGHILSFNATNMTATLNATTSNVTFAAGTAAVSAAVLAQNILGYALTAATTANTNTQILAVLKNLPWANPD